MRSPGPVATNRPDAVLSQRARRIGQRARRSDGNDVISLGGQDLANRHVFLLAEARPPAARAAHTSMVRRPSHDCKRLPFTPGCASVSWRAGLSNRRRAKKPMRTRRYGPPRKCGRPCPARPNPSPMARLMIIQMARKLTVVREVNTWATDRIGPVKAAPPFTPVDAEGESRGGPHHAGYGARGADQRCGITGVEDVVKPDGRNAGGHPEGQEARGADPIGERRAEGCKPDHVDGQVQRSRHAGRRR